MFLIRQAKLDDADMLFKLAKTSHFVNLPPFKDIIESKISESRRSFANLANNQRRPGRVKTAEEPPLFMFCIEDPVSGHCLGTSMIVARMGNEKHPNVAFRLERREYFSDDLHIGTSTQAMLLELDPTGPTEIGGLILTPGFRRHPARVGKQLSLLRFHFIGLYRSLFSDRLLAEMMAPIDDHGNSPFWEYLGRRFINLTYEEAYRASQHTRDFMLNLLPRDPILVALLPPEARRVIGAVGPDTVPAKRMLESMGFRYNGNIDPFDGGPHLDAKTNDVAMIKDARIAEFAGTVAVSRAKKEGFVSVLGDGGVFRAVHCKYLVKPGGEKVLLPKAAAEALQLDGSETIGVTPCSLAGSKPVPVRRVEGAIDEPEPTTRAAKSTRSKTKRRTRRAVSK